MNKNPKEYHFIQILRRTTLFFFAMIISLHAQIVEKTALVSPENNASDRQLALTLSWNSTTGASSYQVQLSESIQFTAPIIDAIGISKTSMEIDSLERGKVYHWRVRGSFLSINGSWSDVWSFRTLPFPPESPVLLFPAYAASDQQLAQQLNWTGSQQAAMYRVRAGLDSGFTVTICDTTTALTSITLTGLQRETKYFWSVQGINSGGSGPWSSVSYFTTLPHPPKIPHPVSPAANAVDQPLDVVLKWNTTQKTTSYQLQVSLRQDFSSFVYNDSSRTDTLYRLESLLHETFYFWRIRSINSGGAGSWSSVTAFSTVPNVPAAVLLSAPDNGAVNQPVSSTLRWYHSLRSVRYRVQLSYRSDFVSLLKDSASIMDTLFRVDQLLNDTLLFWRVAAVNSGGQSPWSTVRSFKTVPQQPSAPVASFPASNTVIDTNSVVLRWSIVPRSSSYWVQVAQDSSFTKITVNDSSVMATSAALNGLRYNEQYHWRIKAMNSGGSSAWSTINTFIIRSADSYFGPELTSPVNNAVDQSRSIVLQWKPVLSALTYQVQVATDANFMSLLTDRTQIISSSIQIDDLNASTVCYWRVRSSYLLFSSDWSSVWKFTTLPNAPFVPQLFSPVNGGANITSPVRFIWNRVSSAVRYQIQISTDAGFSQLSMNSETVADTVFQTTALAEGIKYYWRIASINNGGKSGWSSVWSFTTGISLPPAPTSLFPPDGIKLDSNAITLSWNPVQNALAYTVQLSPDSGFNSVIFQDSMIHSSSIRLTGLIKAATYFWKVRSQQPQSSSKWSEPNSFQTGSSTSAGPGLISPVNNAEDQPTTVTLRWSQDGGASSYHVQVSRDRNFSSLIFEHSSTANTSYQITSLSNSTTYYWRVRSNYLILPSDWSEVWQFTTVPAGPIPPPAPSLIAPSNGAVNQPFVLTIRWSSPEDSVHFHLQVATDAAFTSLTENDSGIISSSKDISSLSANKKYFWKVRSKKNGVWSPSSPVWSFTMKQGDLPTAVTNPPTELTSVSVTLNARVSSNGYPTTIRFQYGTTMQYGNSVDGIPLMVPDTAVSRSITNTLHGLVPNTEYHYRVSTTNQLGSTEGEDRSFKTLLPDYPASYRTNVLFSFPVYPSQSDYKPTDYRIIGLPGNSNIRVDSLLEGISRNEWEMYWDSGDGERTLISYDGSRNFSFSTGRAFWFIKRGQVSFRLDIPTSPLDSNQEVSIPLHAGWNLITNPFDSVIAWESLRSVNGISQPLYAFDGNFILSDSLRPFTGYYFFNDTGRNILRVPYAAIFEQSNIGPGIVHKNSGEGWTISIGLDCASGKDSTAWLGAGNAAAKRYHKPVGFDGLPAVYFDRPDWDTLHRSFATDFHPDQFRSNSWDLTVWNSRRELSTLKFKGVHTIPTHYDVYLLDSKSSRIIDLRHDSSYTFLPLDQKSLLTVVIGPKDSIQDVLSSLKRPGTFDLGNNFPNPFNPETTIPVAVPFHSSLSLEVYNILGQRIRTIFRGNVDPGRYWFRWDGMNDGGSRMTSGIYLYRLTTANGPTVTKKMLYTR